jgi:peptide/nickel transport system substrate-binding protein
VDKLTEITTQKKGGKMAPDFDTFVWGWGGDAYDPSTLLNLLTTKAIGNSSDSFYANAEYDRLYDEQSGEFDQAKRKEIVKRMLAISQRDLPYLVLSVDPILQAYRSDRLAGVQQSCPQPDGDIMCEQVSYAPLLTLAPAAAKATGPGNDGGGSAVVWIVVVVVALGLIVLALVLRGRRRRAAEDEQLEVGA